MNAFEAINKAASFIESTPEQFDFMAYRPRSCKSPGCALGWIAYFAKAKTTRDGAHHDALPVLGLSADIDGAMQFYHEMDDLAQERSWRRDAAECARILRKYAEKHHKS